MRPRAASRIPPPQQDGTVRPKRDVHPSMAHSVSHTAPSPTSLEWDRAGGLGHPGGAIPSGFELSRQRPERERRTYALGRGRRLRASWAYEPRVPGGSSTE